MIEKIVLLILLTLMEIAPMKYALYFSGTYSSPGKIVAMYDSIDEAKDQIARSLPSEIGIGAKLSIREIPDEKLMLCGKYLFARLINNETKMISFNGFFPQGKAWKSSIEVTWDAKYESINQNIRYFCRVRAYSFAEALYLADQAFNKFEETRFNPK